MSVAAFIVFSLLGFWIVSYLLDKAKSGRDGQGQAEMARACEVLQLRAPFTASQLEEAHRQRQEECLQQMAVERLAQVDAAYRYLKPFQF